MAKVCLKGEFWFYGPNLFWASFWTWNSLSWSLNGCMVLACYCTTRLPHSRGASSPEDQQPITKELAFIGGKAFYKLRVSVYSHFVEILNFAMPSSFLVWDFIYVRVTLFKMKEIRAYLGYLVVFGIYLSLPECETVQWSVLVKKWY